MTRAISGRDAIIDNGDGYGPKIEWQCPVCIVLSVKIQKGEIS